MHRELQAVAETEIEFNLQDAADVWHALQPKIGKLSTLEAQNSMKLQQLLQHQNSEASSLTTGMQLYFGIGHISIMVTVTRGGGWQGISKDRNPYIIFIFLIQ